MNCNGFILMESLASLFLVSVVVSVVLPLYLWVFQERLHLLQEQQLLFELEKKRHAYYLLDDRSNWRKSSYMQIDMHCIESVVKKSEENCVYVLAK